MGLYTLLLGGGLALMGCAAAGAVVAAVVFAVSGKRLKARLEKEYGPRRRGK